MDTAQAPARRLTNGLVWSHLALAGLMSAWRVIESTPGLSSLTNGPFAGSPIGRGAAVLSVLACVAAVVCVLVGTFRERRDARALVLFVALGAALWTRQTIDVFDLVYVALVAIVATWTFASAR